MATGTTEIRVRYSETDQMGVVYHTNYLVWCEVGRTDLMRTLGFPYGELERAGVYLAVTDASVRYHAPARYEDRVRVHTQVEEVRSRSITFSYLIVRVAADGDLRLATARTVLVARGADGAGKTLPRALLEPLRQSAAG